MAAMSRRSLINTSIGLAATAALARPYIANAQAKTATVWWVQGFAIEEDIAFKKLVEDYQKASGNKLDYTIIPFAPMRQKIVSAITSGAVPDLFQNSPTEISAFTRGTTSWWMAATLLTPRETSSHPPHKRRPTATTM